jgi:aquaporin Z
MQKYLAEIVGTFILVATILISKNPLAIGLSLAVAAYAIGPISGGHVNPVVSLAVLLDKNISAVETGGYIVAQIIGACLAFAFYHANKDALKA